MLLFFFNLINFKKKKFLHWKTNLKFFHSLHAQWIESLTLHCPWPELTRPSSWGRRPWSHRWWRTGWVWCQGAWGFRRRCWKAPTWSWICSPGSWTSGPRCPDSPPSARSRRWCTRGLPRAEHSCTPWREGFAPRSPPPPRPSPWTLPSPRTAGLAWQASPCTCSLREPKVPPPLFLIGGLICSCGFWIARSGAWLVGFWSIHLLLCLF